MAPLRWTQRCCPVSVLMLLVLVGLGRWREVSGHGRLVDPPSRASMWRYGYDTHHNEDDHAMNCGGMGRQWGVNGGRCGICGESYDGPRDYEAGGKYATGIIVRHFRAGETITVSVEITVSHMGYFEFRLCPNDDPTRRVTQQCLDRWLLRQPDGSTRYQVRTEGAVTHRVQLVLPAGLLCSQCVLQWKYNAGNSWGCDGEGAQRNCCEGCGHQEQYYACADVDITSGSQGGSAQPSSLALGQTTQNTQTAVGPWPYSLLCRGITDRYTDSCRASCIMGPWLCPQSVCSPECIVMQYHSDEAES